MKQLLSVVNRVKALSDCTTSADVAKRIVMKVRAKKKEKRLPRPGSKTQINEQELGRGGGAGPIGRM